MILLIILSIRVGGAGTPNSALGSSIFKCYRVISNLVNTRKRKCRSRTLPLADLGMKY
jgi:hypothetical protein